MAKKNKEVKRSNAKGKKITVTAGVSSDGKQPVWLFTNLDRSGKFAFDVIRRDFDHQDM